MNTQTLNNIELALTDINNRLKTLEERVEKLIQTKDYLVKNFKSKV